jgi:uncharacterized BrkB/YihY/UPF0761 family membrane protein
MNEDWSADSPPKPQPPRSIAVMLMFGLLFFVLVVVPVGMVIYILIDAMATLAPTPADKKPGMQAILIGLTALALGVVAVFALQWFLLKAIFARLTVEGETSSPSATNEEESSEAPPKPL